MRHDAQDSPVTRDIDGPSWVEPGKGSAEGDDAHAELEAVLYAVSHDFRAPLRSIHGFSQILLEDYRDALDARGQDYLRRVSDAADRMEAMIEGVLLLSRIGRYHLGMEPADLSAIAREVVADLQRNEPERRVDFTVAPSMKVYGDVMLLRTALGHILANAWKFTGNTAQAKVEFGRKVANEETVFFVRDNGAGFDMALAERLFKVFQRLHADHEFSGLGIGLAIARRVIARHGGRLWAEGIVGGGATFYFTLGPAASGAQPE